MRNIDRIKAMTVEEMAEFIRSITQCNDNCPYSKTTLICGAGDEQGCREHQKQWLLMEVTNE